MFWLVKIACLGKLRFDVATLWTMFYLHTTSSFLQFGANIWESGETLRLLLFSVVVVNFKENLFGVPVRVCIQYESLLRPSTVY